MRSLGPVLSIQDRYNRFGTANSKSAGDCGWGLSTFVHRKYAINIRPDCPWNLLWSWSTPSALFDAMLHVFCAGSVLKVFQSVVGAITIYVIHVHAWAFSMKCFHHRPVNTFVGPFAIAIKRYDKISLVHLLSQNHALEALFSRYGKGIAVWYDALDGSYATKIRDFVKPFKTEDRFPGLFHSANLDIGLRGDTV